MSSERKILKATRSKKKDFVNSLPDEVLFIVFDFLDLENVKNAAITCQRWNSLIFLSGYVNRFVFKVYMDSDAHRWTWVNKRNTTEQSVVIKKFKDMVATSHRCYRNLHYRGRLSKKSGFSWVWKTTHPKLANHLHSLEFSLLKPTILLPLLADALPLMTELRSLTISSYRSVCYTQDIIPTLRSNSVKHLAMPSNVKYRLDMPQLQTFDGSLSAFYLPENSGQSTALSTLKDLTVNHEKLATSRQYLPMLSSLFRRMTSLETIKWGPSLRSEIFSLICETCTSLKELEVLNGFDGNIHSSSLTMLTNLRTLALGFIEREIDLSTVNQLEEVQLLNINDVVKLPMSVRKLEMNITSDNELDMSHTILSCSAQLTELLVEIHEEDKSLKYHAPYEIMKVLSRLKQLKVLKFYRGRFRKSSFCCMDAPLDTLLQLHFKESNVSSRHFLGLEEKFPNLKKLTFTKCGSWKEDYDNDSASMTFTESEEDFTESEDTDSVC